MRAYDGVVTRLLYILNDVFAAHGGKIEHQ